MQTETADTKKLSKIAAAVHERETLEDQAVAFERAEKRRLRLENQAQQAAARLAKRRTELERSIVAAKACLNEFAGFTSDELFRCYGQATGPALPPTLRACLAHAERRLAELLGAPVPAQPVDPDERMMRTDARTI